MIRTRDFLLFLISIAFLVMAIGVEFIQNFRIDSQINQPVTFNFSDDHSISYSAEVITVPDTKAEKLEALRRALEEQNLIISFPEPEEVIVEEPVPDVPTTTVSNIIQLCKNYRPTFIPWTTEKINNEEREGMRVFYSTEPETVLTTSTTSVAETIHAVLPIRSVPLIKPICISGDVVGIALDGSLIRNNEQKIYGVFGETTMIGYGLDGFPIYGLSANRKTDTCGGVLVDGSYRYYLDKERDGILGCFSGIPINL